MLSRMKNIVEAPLGSTPLVRKVMVSSALLMLFMTFGQAGLAEERVDINRAGVDELVTVKGLSEAQAKAIVEDRKLRGAFKSAGELVRVRGVGRGTFKKICRWVVVDQEPGCMPDEGSSDDVIEVINDADADFRININAADADALMALPGIGPKRAAQIISRRREKGPFDRAEALIEIKGIGPKTLKKLLPFVRVTSELNSVTKEELLATGAVTSKQANMIIKARQRRGQFRSKGQLRSVPTITQAVYEALSPFLTHNGEL